MLLLLLLLLLIAIGVLLSAEQYQLAAKETAMQRLSRASLLLPLELVVATGQLQCLASVVAAR
jgi:hypothetical protein